MSSQPTNFIDLGYFADSDEEGDIEAEAEDPELYKPAQYFPVCIGETLQNRYRIEHKLGYGGFSTVWLAYDMHTMRNVALKIMLPGKTAERDYAIQQHIIRQIRDTSNLLVYLDTFQLPGINCTHQVLVFPVLGHSLGCGPIKMKLIAGSRRMSAAKQLLQALAYLHEGGIVHHDLTEKNVIFGMTLLDTLSIDEKYRGLGRPLKMPIRPPPWRPGELVRPIRVPDTWLTDKIYLADFGLSFQAGALVGRKWREPVSWCAPERFHDFNPSYASDMWSYMCLFAQLYTGFQIFYPLRFHETSYVGLHTRFVDVLGPMPAQWRGCWKGTGANKPEWYNQSTESKPQSTLSAFLRECGPEVSEYERKLVVLVMSKVFHYLPEQRMGAAQLLEDTSFKALLELYGVV